MKRRDLQIFFSQFPLKNWLFFFMPLDKIYQYNFPRVMLNIEMIYDLQLHIILIYQLQQLPVQDVALNFH